jgi:MinD superfamily P-loop ATPase
MQELVVISGKGGTGKTSLVASFAVLADSLVLADCDVDAADLHLVLAPTVLRQEEFSGGSQAEIDADKCIACGQCEEVCRFGAVSLNGAASELVQKTYRVDPIACEGCGVCAWFCEHEAIRFGPVVNGRWFASDTRCGPMVHARLVPGGENSGKLVTVVRSEAKRIAAERGLELILVDGSPGIGCPVIASITGADVVLAVTEPTQSGLHDLGRVAELTAHFNVTTLAVINKWDLNPKVSRQIEAEAGRRGVRVVGRVRYDDAVTKAQVQGQSVVEYAHGPVVDDVRRTWEGLTEALSQIERGRKLRVL